MFSIAYCVCVCVYIYIHLRVLFMLKFLNFVQVFLYISLARVVKLLTLLSVGRTRFEPFEKLAQHADGFVRTAARFYASANPFTD